MLVHLFGHQVESLNLRNQLDQLFLQLYLFLLDQEVLDFLGVLGALAGLHLVLADDVGIVADDGLHLQLLLHLVLLLLYLYLNRAVLLLGLHLDLGHLLLQLLDLLFLEGEHLARRLQLLLLVGLTL